MASNLVWGCMYHPINFLFSVPNAVLYGSWKTLLSKSKNSSIASLTPAETLTLLEETVKLLESQVTEVQEKRKTAVEEGKTALREKKQSKAKRCLARAESLQKRETELENMIYNQTENMDRIRNNEVALMVIEVNNRVKHSLMGTMGEITPEGVKKVMQEIHDIADEADEVNRKLQDPINPDPLTGIAGITSDADLMKMLDQYAPSSSKDQDEPESSAQVSKPPETIRISSFPEAPKKQPVTGNGTSSRTKTSSLSQQLLDLIDT